MGKDQKTVAGSTQALWSIADVATELGITPQAASAFHRGPEGTPAPSFRVTGSKVELWTIEDVEEWHTWLDAFNTSKREAAAAKAAGKAKPEPVEDPAPELDDLVEDLPETGDLTEVDKPEAEAV